LRYIYLTETSDNKMQVLYITGTAGVIEEGHGDIVFNDIPQQVL